MDFLGRFLGFSNLERFTSVLYDHPGPPWFYLPWVLLLLFPWALFLPVSVVGLRPWRLAPWRSVPPGADLPLFALVWLVMIVAFFSAAATKLPGYILPAVPGGALLLALSFHPLPAGEADAPPFGGGRRLTGWINAGVLGLMAVAASQAPRLAGGDPSYPGFSDALASSGLPWLLAGLLLAAALALGVLLLRPGGSALAWLWLPNAAAFLALLAVVVPTLAPLLDRERLLPIRELARIAGRAARGDEPLVVVGYKRYSVVPYSGRPVLFASSPGKVRRHLDDRPAAPTVLLLGSDAELRDFGLVPGDGDVIARRQALQLLRLPSGRLDGLEKP
jgi:4-amino-4-deoxy-L-arabinose transferase-like glycosyltransferase